MLDVYELRRILECEAAALAAERHTDAHLALMDAAIEEMAAALASDGPERGDALHRRRPALPSRDRRGDAQRRRPAHDATRCASVIRRALMSIFLDPRQPRALARAAPRDPRGDRGARRRRSARAEMRAHLVRVESDVHNALTAGAPATGGGTMAEVGYVGLGVMGGGDRAAPARRRPRRHGLEPHAREGRAAARRRACAGPRPRARSPSGARSSSRWSRTPPRCARSPTGPTGSSPASRPGKVYVDMRTASPDEHARARRARRGAGRADARRARLGQRRSRSSRASCRSWSAATRTSFERVEPMLEAIGPKVLPRRAERPGGDDEDRDQPEPRRADARVQRGRAARREERHPARARRRGAARERDRLADGRVPRPVRARAAGRGLVRLQHDAEGHEPRARARARARRAAADDRDDERAAHRRARHGPRRAGLRRCSSTCSRAMSGVETSVRA